MSVLPTLVTLRFGLPLDVAALAISAHYLTDTLGRSPSGWLIDRLGAGRVMEAGMALAVLAILLVAFAGPASPLWLYLALYGVGTSPLWPAVITSATDGRAEDRGRIIGGIFTVWIVAIGLGPMLMNFVLPAHLKAALTGLLLIQLVALLVARTLPMGSRRFTPPFPDRTLWHRVRQIKVLFPGMFAQTLTVGILLPVINTFIRRVLGLTGFRYGELLAFGGCLAVVLMIPFGRLSDRFGVRPPLVAGFALAGAGLIVLGAARQFLEAMALAAMVGVAYALILPAWNSLLASTVDRPTAGALWGVFMTVEGLGLTTGPLVGVRAWDLLQPFGPFLVCGGILLVMSLFYAVYPLDRLTLETFR